MREPLSLIIGIYDEGGSVLRLMNDLSADDYRLRAMGAEARHIQAKSFIMLHARKSSAFRMGYKADGGGERGV